MNTRLIALGKRLREARMHAGLSQVDVAKRIGKSKQLASAWEAGRAEMLATTLGDFVRIASTDANWLLLGIQSGKAKAGAPTLPSGGVVPLLSIEKALLAPRGTVDLSSAERVIFSCFPCPPRSFALEVTDDAMSPKLMTGDVVVIEPDRPMRPGSLVAAIVKKTDAIQRAPFLVLRCIHYGSSDLTAPPFELVPVAPAWPTLSIKKRGHASLLGAVSMIFRREASSTVVPRPAVHVRR